MTPAPSLFYYFFRFYSFSSCVYFLIFFLFNSSITIYSNVFLPSFKYHFAYFFCNFSIFSFQPQILGLYIITLFKKYQKTSFSFLSCSPVFFSILTLSNIPNVFLFLALWPSPTYTVQLLLFFLALFFPCHSHSVLLFPD